MPHSPLPPSLQFLNRTLFQGENLDFLRGLNSETIDLIATDPPYNKGKDFHATPDSLASGASFQDRWTWDADVHPAWKDQIRDDYPRLMEAIESAKHAHSEAMGAFMCWLSVRLIEMRRILTPTGSIYLHCDLTASHYIKACMDAIFGPENFRNEVSWLYGKMNAASRNFPQNRDSLFFYTKSDQYAFNVLKGGESEYKTRYLKFVRNNKIYYGDVKHKTDKMVVNRAAAYKRKHSSISDDSVLWDFDVEFKRMDNNWQIPIMRGNDKERTGYPTQKPIEIYRRIVSASSNKGDWVLDPFCGCATTLIAAEGLDRKWIGMDLWKGALELVEKRLSDASVGGDGMHLSRPEVYLEKTPPERTDDGKTNAPYLRALYSAKGPRMSRDAMKEWLLEDLKEECGELKCAGCGHVMPNGRYFHLDHVEPKSGGGGDMVGNRILLCGPCNGTKSNKLTLELLMKENKKEGALAEDSQQFINDLKDLQKNLRLRAREREQKFLIEIGERKAA